MKKILLLIFSVILILQVQAQEELVVKKKGVLIIGAGKSYKNMVSFAKAASSKLSYKIDFRGLVKNQLIGLSLSEEACETKGLKFPSYVPRGTSDNGNYISIEYSNAYKGCVPKHYIIIVASHNDGSAELKEAFEFVTKYYGMAYFDYIEVKE